MIETADSLDTNLLAGRKKSEAPAPLPPSRRRVIVKRLGYVVIFLVALLFFVSLKLPSSMVQALVIDGLSKAGFRGEAESINFRLLFFPHIHAQKFSLEPIRGGAPRVVFDELDVYPSLLGSLLSLGPKATFSGLSYGAQFDGSVAPKNSALSLDLTNADLTKITPLTESGADIRGLISQLTADLSLEEGRMSRLKGTIRADGKNFVVDPASFQSVMPFPILDLGVVTLRATADRGKVNIESLQLGAPGKDMEIKITGTLTLADVMQLSKVDLRIALKPAPKIAQALPQVMTMLGNLAHLRDDGFYAMRLSGTMGGLGLPVKDVGP